MKNKDLIVVTTRGLYRYNEQADNFEILKFFPETYHYTNFKEDSDGNLWAGSYRDGLLFTIRKRRKRGFYL